ncbi:hypothetical protein BDZ89DRAFT_902464, partial [Hymenopellis radicata]
NPFAIASWLHLVRVRCRPFDDGNGRTTGLISSIPLLRHGYPPISIPLDMLDKYFRSIDNAYHGNHGPLTQCMLDGM